MPPECNREFPVTTHPMPVPLYQCVRPCRVYAHTPACSLAALLACGPNTLAVFEATASAQPSDFTAAVKRERTDNALKGTGPAARGTDIAVKGTDNAVKRTDNAVKCTDNAVKGTDR